MSGLYVHIPFCASRCIYCGFYSTTGLNLRSSYVDALLGELRYHTANGMPFHASPWKTIYFGGGTPSTLPIPILNRLVTGSSSIIDTDSITEWTMECNPDDVTPELAAWLGTSPINRVSMGVQTFDDNRLRWLRRRHTSQQASDAVALLRDNGISNISIDLMFGFPGQSTAEWDADIAKALALRPQHISAYSLMYEEGTPLYRLLERGEIEEIDEETSLQMFETLVTRLTAAGYEHYEISNFALDGFRSQHNSSYWHQVPYLGIGAAAHSYDGNERWWNVSDMRKWSTGSTPSAYIEGSETIDATTRYNDIITTALRTREGVSLEALPEEQRTYLLEQATPHLRAKKVAITGQHLHLTHDGIYTSDDIMSDLILV